MYDGLDGVVTGSVQWLSLVHVLVINDNWRIFGRYSFRNSNALFMSVYVDPLIDYGWKLGPSCHMTADTLEELHAMADKIGMKRSWFQNEQHSMPHYDLVKSRRDRAVKLGAIELTRLEAGEMYRKYRQSKQLPSV